MTLAETRSSVSIMAVMSASMWSRPKKSIAWRRANDGAGRYVGDLSPFRQKPAVQY
jgi:hypothetical protein